MSKFRKWYVWFGLAALTAGASAAAMRLHGSPTPKIGPEHAALAQLVGTWKVDATLSPGPWGRGGPVNSKQTCRVFEALHVICDSEAADGPGPSRSHAMYSYHPALKKYVYVAFPNSLYPEPGALYPEHGAGKHDGRTWTWLTVIYLDGKKLPARSTLTASSSNLSTFATTISRDDMKSWSPVVEGKKLMAGAITTETYVENTRHLGPEHKNLARRVGTWKFDGVMKPGPGGPGGPVSSTEMCRMVEAYLICEAETSGAAGQINSHSMYIYHPVKKQYQGFSINNTSPYQDYYEGTYNGNRWVWTSSAEVDGKKVLIVNTVTETSPTAHTSSLKISSDVGKTWTTIMDGHSIKH